MCLGRAQRLNGWVAWAVGVIMLRGFRYVELLKI
jgi:hypothetical protein